MSIVTVERAKLYRQVWSIPGTKLAITYGISDVGLAKVCKRYSIPRPPRGYWARRAVGQKMRRPPLPKIEKEFQVVYLKGWNMADETIQRMVIENDPQKIVTKAVSNAAGSPPHPLVVANRTQLAALTPNHEGFVKTDPATALDVSISSPLVERCLQIMDKLIKQWEEKGGSVKVGAAAAPKGTAFAVGPDELYIQVVEDVDKSKSVTDSARLSRRLVLFVNGDERQEFRRRWSDTKSQPLDKMIGPLIQTLLNALAVRKSDRLDAECMQRQQQKVNAFRKVNAADESREFYWRQELMESVGRWHAAQQIREYLDDIGQSIKDGRSRVTNEDSYKTWVDWARRYVNSIDPIRNHPLPGQSAAEPKNTPMSEIELTSYTSPIIAKLNVTDTDQLSRVTPQQLRLICSREFSDVWNEFTRILEALSYPVSKRNKTW